jgi:hypothetical protein
MQQGILGLKTETSFDGQGNTFWGRVDILNNQTKEIWEIKPDSLANQIYASATAEVYALTSKGPDQYSLGGTGLLMPTGPLHGQMGDYTYVNTGGGAILWSDTSSTRLNSTFYQATQNQTHGGAAFLSPLIRTFAIP